MGKLIQDYDYVVIDNEAGLEHLSRRTTRAADTLLVVSDATPVGLRAAKRISALAKELKIQIKKNLLVVNRLAGVAEENCFKGLGLDYIGKIPVDEQIYQISLNGNSLLKLKSDSVSMRALLKIGEKIWQHN